jgi:hypothetical protein
MLNRRNFLIGITAPAIVHYGNLMPVRVLREPEWVYPPEPDWYPPFYAPWEEMADLIHNVTLQTPFTDYLAKAQRASLRGLIQE